MSEVALEGRRESVFLSGKAKETARRLLLKGGYGQCGKRREEKGFGKHKKKKTLQAGDFQEKGGRMRANTFLN